MTIFWIRLRTFLDLEVEEFKTITTVSDINGLIEKELRNDMSLRCIRSRMEPLFVAYSPFLCGHDFKWVKDINPEIYVGHVVPTIKPQQLRTRPQDNLKLAYKNLRMNFNRIKAPALEISDTFEKSGIGPTNKHQDNGNKNRHGNGLAGGTGASNKGISLQVEQGEKTAGRVVLDGSHRSFCMRPVRLRTCVIELAIIRTRRTIRNEIWRRPLRLPALVTVRLVVQVAKRHTQVPLKLFLLCPLPETTWNYGSHHAWTRCTSIRNVSLCSMTVSEDC